MRYGAVILMVMVALLAAACGGKQPAQQPTPPAAQPPAAPTAAGQTVTVKMSEFKYEMQPTEVSAGPVTFRIENVGTVEHDFLIEGLDKGTEALRPGQSTTLTVDLKPGTYTIFCKVAGHKEAGMHIQLVVK
ncbi:MAG: cupredoxin domain-containing protein [Armatimonadota bacterium]|nr:cupredoxin domain-containing protein [Armatimonadota bacterium]MDR7503675.1 cupredoxin domain-containing protein [Armatimonadota bacterium]